MKIIDESHPFYRPLWRRVALVAVLAAVDYVFTRQSFMKRMRMSRRPWPHR